MQAASAIGDAIQRHEGYLESDAGNLSLRLKLGDLYHQAGRLDDALACYRHCLEQEPMQAAARGRIASVRITQHEFAAAEQALRELLAEGGADPALLHNLGLALYFQQRWQEAQDCFEQAAAAGLGAPANFAYLARAAHHLGDMARAVEAGRQWVGSAQDSASKSYLSLLHMDNEDMASARLLALEVLAEDPNDGNANIVQGTVQAELQEMAQARRHFEIALGQDAGNGRAWLGLGLCYLYEHDHAKAIEALGRAVSIYPDNPGMIVALGWAQIAARDAAAAEKTFEQALRADHSFAESHGGMATALAMQQKVEQAKTHIHLARRLNSKGFGAEFARVTILASQGKTDTARVAFERILEQTPPRSMRPLIEELRIYSTKRGAAGRPAGNGKDA